MNTAAATASLEEVSGVSKAEIEHALHLDDSGLMRTVRSISDSARTTAAPLMRMPARAGKMIKRHPYQAAGFALAAVGGVFLVTRLLRSRAAF